MLHSEKARANHSADRTRMRRSTSNAFATERASDLVRDGAPLQHIEHMIKKGYVVDDRI